MATLVQNITSLLIGSSTVYWQGAPVTWMGYFGGTNCSLISQADKKTLDVVLTASLTTTALG